MKIATAVMIFSIFVSIPPSFASTDTYDSGRDHGCDDARITDPSDRYINQPGKGPAFQADEFMDGYYDGFNMCSTGTNNPNNDYPDYFLDENLSSSSDIGRNGNVTLGAECGMRALDDDQVYQQLSEDQCFYFNSCMNLGGSIQGCYESARNINCDIESGIRYNCPGAVYGSK